MNITLTPELENAVRRKVETGMYADESEVIREALRMSMAKEIGDEGLKREAEIGFLQLERGESVSISSKEEFISAARQPS